MRKILFLTALLASTCLSTNAQTVESIPEVASVPQVTAVPEFGYLSYDSVMQTMPEYENAMKSLESLKASYEEEMKRAEENFSKQFKEYVDGQKSFPENIMLKRQKELQQLMDQSLQFKKEAEELLTKAKAELMQPVIAHLKLVIEAIGLERGYDYILNTDNNAYPFINKSKGEDINAIVISRLKK